MYTVHGQFPGLLDNVAEPSLRAQLPTTSLLGEFRCPATFCHSPAFRGLSNGRTARRQAPTAAPRARWRSATSELLQKPHGSLRRCAIATHALLTCVRSAHRNHPPRLPTCSRRQSGHLAGCLLSAARPVVGCTLAAAHLHVGSRRPRLPVIRHHHDVLFDQGPSVENGAVCSSLRGRGQALRWPQPACHG